MTLSTAARTAAFVLVLLLPSLVSGIELISVNAAGNATGNGFSSTNTEELRYFSGDGRFIVFRSAASNLGPTDTNGANDVYLRDRSLGTIELISVNTAGDDSGNGGSTNASISADGRYVVFQSDAPDLVAVDTNGQTDVFIRDRTLGTTTLVSRNMAGTDSAAGSSFPSSLTPDGRYLTFQSDADDLVGTDTNGALDVFLYTVQTGVVTLVSINSAGTDTGGGQSTANQKNSISYDGQFVVFHSEAADLVAVDGNGEGDIFLRDVVAGTTTMISRNFAGTDSAAGNSVDGRIAPNGSVISFNSAATDVLNITDNNAAFDVFVHDRVAGTTELVTWNAAGTATGNGNASSGSRMSDDGAFIVFESGMDDLVTIPDNNNNTDVFMRDLANRSTTLVSINSAGTASVNAGNNDAHIGPRGRLVYYDSNATDVVNVIDNNSTNDIFIFDSRTGTNHLVSLNAAGTATGNDTSYDVAVSDDGLVIAFDSVSTDLVAGISDTNAAFDLFAARVSDIVPNAAPTAGFSALIVVRQVAFTDTSSDTDGTLIRHQWDFGDGTTSSEQNPMHTYASDGDYTVTLTVTDDLGGTATLDQTVSIGGSGGGGSSSGFALSYWLLAGLLAAAWRRLSTRRE